MYLWWLMPNKKLKKIYLDKEITRCELCGSTFILSWHHRHKRRFYNLNKEALADFNQTILLCARCHDRLEKDKEETRETFKRLRGDEDIIADNSSVR